MTVLRIDTPHGPAGVELYEAVDARAALAIGHGAGGGTAAVDIQAAKDAALEVGVSVALVEQPYRVAGRKSPAPAKQLDAAWLAVVEHLQAGELAGLPFIAGGRSLGARVACRTAGEAGAVAVLCLAFPLQPPRRKGKELAPSRLTELEAVDVPMLIVQGESDQFGMPPEGPNRRVATVPGSHGLKSDIPGVGAAVREWLPGVTS